MLFAIFLYFLIVFLIGVFSFQKNLDSEGFIIGNRSLNYWLTALAAHASDMSSWLFMAYPAMIFLFGLNKIWIAIGLIVCMFCNWQFVAPRIRVATERLNCLTFFSYLERQYADRSGMLRLVTVFLCFVFYTIYVSAGLVGLGLLVESLFPISYKVAVILSILLAVPYVLIGGYRTLAWLDLFQGIFLLVIIIFVPCFLFSKVGGWDEIIRVSMVSQRSLQILPDFKFTTLLTTLLVMLGWGLGYFGQPAIITKFMGIKDVSKISKSKLVGMVWMVLSLAAATLVGLVGIAYFSGNSLHNPEMLFINLVKSFFSPFFIGLILCAIFAASINVMCSQILVLCSTFTEDIYKKIFRVKASSKELLLVSRLGVIVTAAVAFVIAYFKVSSIYSLVLYAWSGLGSAFGPLLIFSLYSKKRSIAIAWVGIITGGLASALWPFVGGYLGMSIDPIIIGFGLSSLSIGVLALLSREHEDQPTLFQTDTSP